MEITETITAGLAAACLDEHGHLIEHQRRPPRRDRYDTGRPRDRWGRTPERRLLQPTGVSPGSPRDAAVLLLARAAGLGEGPERPVDEVLNRTGDLRRFCDLARDAISQERAKNLQAYGAMRAGRIIGAPG